MARRGDNIHKRKDGRWEGRYPLKDSCGKVRLHSVYAANYTECRQKLIHAMQSIPRNGLSDHPDISGTDVWTETAAQWLLYIKNNRKYSTYIKYFNIYQCYIDPLLKKQDIMPEWNRVIFERNDISESTKKCIYTVLRGISGQAEKNGMKKINIQMEFQKNRRKQIEILNKTEQENLLRYLYKDMDLYKMGIVLCLSTGLRLGELCSLKHSDIDQNSGIMHINHTVQRISAENAVNKTFLLESMPKTDCSVRQIPLSDELLYLIDKYSRNTIYIFGGNKPMEPRTYQNKFKRYLYEAGIKERNFHILRHTFASNCIIHGADVKSISEIMGHSDVRITLNRYMHPSMEDKRDQISSLTKIYGQYRGQIIN